MIEKWNKKDKKKTRGVKGRGRRAPAGAGWEAEAEENRQVCQREDGAEEKSGKNKA